MSSVSEGATTTSGIRPMCSDSRLYSFLSRLKCFFWPRFIPQEMTRGVASSPAACSAYVPSTMQNGASWQMTCESMGVDADRQNDR